MDAGRLNDYVIAMRHLLARLAMMLAVLLMPLGMAPAAAAQGHSMQGMPMEHCSEQGSNHQSKAAFAQCTMACASALPAADLASIAPVERAEAPVAAVVALGADGLRPAIDTPPPRAS